MPSQKRPDRPHARPLRPQSPRKALQEPAPPTPATDESFWPFEPFDAEKLGPNLFQSVTLTPEEEAQIEQILAEIDAEAERGRVARAAKAAARRAAKTH